MEILADCNSTRYILYYCYCKNFLEKLRQKSLSKDSQFHNKDTFIITYLGNMPQRSFTDKPPIPKCVENWKSGI